MIINEFRFYCYFKCYSLFVVSCKVHVLLGKKSILIYDIRHCISTTTIIDQRSIKPLLSRRSPSVGLKLKPLSSRFDTVRSKSTSMSTSTRARCTVQGYELERCSRVQESSVTYAACAEWPPLPCVHRSCVPSLLDRQLSLLVAQLPVRTIAQQRLCTAHTHTRTVQAYSTQQRCTP